MKKYETLWELPKCYTETKSEQMTMEKNGADRIDQINVAANLPFVKKKKMQYLQGTIKLSAIKQGTPV